MHIQCKDLYMKRSMKYIVSRAGNANVGCCACSQQEFIFSRPDHHAIIMLIWCYFKSLWLLILSDKWLITSLDYTFLILLFAYISLLEFIWTFIHLLISVKFLISIFRICLLFRIFILVTKKRSDLLKITVFIHRYSCNKSSMFQWETLPFVYYLKIYMYLISSKAKGVCFVSNKSSNNTYLQCTIHDIMYQL